MTAVDTTLLLVAQMLLSAQPRWYSPQLLQLPRQYDRIFQHYRHKTCSACNSQPKDPAICLVCGALLCSKERCCYQSGKFECCQVSVAVRSVFVRGQ